MTTGIWASYSSTSSNSDVVVIDPAANPYAVAATVTGFSGSDGLPGVAALPNGTKTYVTDASANTVIVIDNSTNAVITGAGYPISVGATPHGLAVTPNGNMLLVANTNSPSISVINTSSDTVSSTITTGLPNSPQYIAITPDGTTAYVTHSLVPGEVSAIDLTTTPPALKTGAGYPISISLGNTSVGIAISPDGRTAYIANEGSDNVAVIDLTASPPTVSSYINVGTSPVPLAIRPDGAEVYVGNENNGAGGGTVSVINTAPNTPGFNTVTHVITVNGAPNGIAFTANSTLAYVTGTDASFNDLSVINTTSRAVVATLSPPSGSGYSVVGTIPQQTPTEPDMIAPQGRLTLSSTSPVMTSDLTGATTIYYLPYVGNGVPVSNGSTFTNYALGSSGISLALDSNSGHTGYQQSGMLFDIFAFINSSVLTLGTGPAWTNSTTRSNAISQVSGIWVNTASITLRFGSASGNTVSVGANEATYLGTMYATLDGQTGMQFIPAGAAGGSNSILGLYNAYNRVSVWSQNVDSTSSWTYSTPANTWRASNSSTANCIRYVDGLAQSFVNAFFFQGTSQSASIQAFIGIQIDASTGTPPGYVTSGFGASTPLYLTGRNSFNPRLGLHYCQCMEWTSGATATYYGGGNMILQIGLDM